MLDYADGLNGKRQDLLLKNWAYLLTHRHSLHQHFPMGSPLRHRSKSCVTSNILTVVCRNSTAVTVPTWVFASVECNPLAIYFKTVLAALNVTIVCAVNGVVLEHVCSILWIAEGVVDGYDLDIRVLHRSTQNKPADAAEPIDANLDLIALSHVESVLNLGLL